MQLSSGFGGGQPQSQPPNDAHPAHPPTSAPPIGIIGIQKAIQTLKDTGDKVYSANKAKQEALVKREQAKDALAVEAAKRQLEAVDRDLETAKRQFEQAKRQMEETYHTKIYVADSELATATGSQPTLVPPSSNSQPHTTATAPTPSSTATNNQRRTDDWAAGNRAQQLRRLISPSPLTTFRRTSTRMSTCSCGKLAAAVFGPTANSSFRPVPIRSRNSPRSSPRRPSGTTRRTCAPRQAAVYLELSAQSGCHRPMAGRRSNPRRQTRRQPARPRRPRGCPRQPRRLARHPPRRRTNGSRRPQHGQREGNRVRHPRPHRRTFRQTDDRRYAVCPVRRRTTPWDVRRQPPLAATRR